MIVDDEPLVRLAIKSLTSWENYGFNLNYEANNGKQALKIIKEEAIDLVVTDLNMPIMDGLQLIQELKRLELPQRIAVLSAYDDYYLVREAFRYGADDYILKPEMDVDNILKLLQDLSNRMEDKSKLSDDDPALTKKILREKLLRDLIIGGKIDDLDKKIKELRFGIGKQNLVCCFFWVDDYHKIVNKYGQMDLGRFQTSVGHSINQVLAEGKGGEYLSLSPQEYIIVLSFPDVGLNEVRKRVLETVNTIKHSLKTYINITVSTGVSSVKTGYEHIGKLFAESKQYAKLRFIFGKDRIVFPEDTAVLARENHPPSFLKNKEQFLLALKENDPRRVFMELEAIFDKIRSFDVLKIEETYPYYMEILFLIINFLNELGEESNEVFERETDFYTTISRFETVFEINNWIKNLVGAMLHYLQEKASIRLHRAVVRACQFVKDNYQEEITLPMIGEFVGLSESHFSRLFAKEMGENFIDYLTKIRITKAKELFVTTNLKVYEIAEKVGYTSAEHFSRIFKRYTGESPSNYKG